MPSPFPGMDPYLEPYWLDVHARLVTYAADALAEQLPEDLVASTEERVAIEGEDDRLLSPDVRVFEPPADAPQVIEEVGSGGVVALKFRLRAQVEPITEKFVKILVASTERLVTVIEFVSPTNKRGEGLRAFRNNRADLLATGVNFVEIDLVRAGNWQALLHPHATSKGASLYRATIRVPRDPDVVHLEPIQLLDHLPELPIPLREQNANVTLKLQPLLNRVYENGRYARRIDYYRGNPEPALDSHDLAWADQLLRAAQRR